MGCSECDIRNLRKPPIRISFQPGRAMCSNSLPLTKLRKVQDQLLFKGSSPAPFQWKGGYMTAFMEACFLSTAKVVRASMCFFAGLGQTWTLIEVTCWWKWKQRKSERQQGEGLVKHVHPNLTQWLVLRVPLFLWLSRSSSREVRTRVPTCFFNLF